MRICKKRSIFGRVYARIVWVNLILTFERIKNVLNNLPRTYKNIDDILHKGAGCSSGLDYIETSWILFLRY
jgi:hypothetical protein